MSLWRWLCLMLLLPGSLYAQVLSPQQLDYLRQQFVENLENTADGSAIAVGTLPPDRIEGQVPASKIIEADPIASVLANTAQSAADAAQASANTAQTAADAAQATADAAQSSASGAQGDADALDTRLTTAESNISSLQASSVTWNAAAVLADEWDASTAANTTFATTLVFNCIGSTITLYIADGLITNAVEVP